MRQFSRQFTVPFLVMCVAVGFYSAVRNKLDLDDTWAALTDAQAKGTEASVRAEALRKEVADLKRQLGSAQSKAKGVDRRVKEAEGRAREENNRIAEGGDARLIRTRQAMVRLTSGDRHLCHGSLVRSTGAPFILTAAHCFAPGSLMDSAELIEETRADDGTAPPSFVSVPADLAHPTLDAKNDVAIVQLVGLTPARLKELDARALQLHKAMPPKGTPVSLYHWHTDTRMGYFAQVIGFAGGIVPGRSNLYTISAGSYGGVSGSPAVDPDGYVVGVVSRASGARTLVVGPRTVRLVCDRSFGKGLAEEGSKPISGSG